MKEFTCIICPRGCSLKVDDNGNVAGIGTHEQLLNSCELYKEIYDSQFKKEGAV